MTTPGLFGVSVPSAVMAELKNRLTGTRWPDEPPPDPCSTGTTVSYLKELGGILAGMIRLTRAGSQAQLISPVQGAPHSCVTYWAIRPSGGKPGSKFSYRSLFFRLKEVQKTLIDQLKLNIVGIAIGFPLVSSPFHPFEQHNVSIPEDV